MAYHLSWYLNITNPGWEALVDGDYENVMPLPVRRKYGMVYLIQPFLIQQLGVISARGKTSDAGEFLREASKIYRYINLNLNRYNVCNNPEFLVSDYNNHELNLNQSIAELEEKYSRRTKRNIGHAQESNLQLVDNITAKEFTDFKATHANPPLNNRFRSILEDIVSHTIKNGTGRVLAAKNTKGELISAAFYFWFKNRIYLLVTVSSEEGKQTSTMHLILDRIIQENAGSNKILDFTGSNLEGVAYFNEGFGASLERYSNVHLNRLPWIIRCFKR
ncbi:MAG TPA: hypothetical protein DIW31_07795 [Bacteroidales bacterium]|nr:hypothetical protein [Bacteroidales bacterium]